MGKLLALTLCLVCMQTALADYRLKYQATVDILDESGKVTGKKTLKAGTIITLAESASDSKSAGSAKSSAHLQPTDISPAMWKSTHPNHAVLRAEIRLDSYYNWSFDTKKKSHWSVYISALNADWSGIGESIYGYAPKSTAVGKKVAKLLADGKDHLALVKLQPTRKENEDDMAIIEDFEIVEDSDE